jgi:hypothetical protein
MRIRASQDEAEGQQQRGETSSAKTHCKSRGDCAGRQTAAFPQT